MYNNVRSVKPWFSTENINVFGLPVQSLDLNPIENLWANVKRAVEEEINKNVNELFQNVQELCQNI